MQSNARTGPQTFKATDLLNDYAVLENGQGYGYITDLVFQGRTLKSLVVSASSPNFEYGTFAYPWTGWGRSGSPGLSYYRLPYGPGQVTELKAFNDSYLSNNAIPG